MLVSEYEKRFSELVRLVPYIQVDEVLKCKRFLEGLQDQSSIVCGSSGTDFGTWLRPL